MTAAVPAQRAATYDAALTAIAAGVRVCADEVLTFAAVAGVSPVQLVADLLAIRRAQPATAGDAPLCPRCGSLLVCVGSRRVGPHQIRRLVCRQCRATAGKTVIPAAMVHKKRKRYDSARPSRKSGNRR